MQQRKEHIMMMSLRRREEQEASRLAKEQRNALKRMQEQLSALPSTRGSGEQKLVGDLSRFLWLKLIVVTGIMRLLLLVHVKLPQVRQFGLQFVLRVAGP